VPLWIAALLGGLVQAVGTLVGRVLVSLGLGLVVYSGLDTSLSWLGAETMARLSSVSSLGSTAVALLGVLQVGTCVNILLSALSVRLVLRGLTSGTVKRWVHK
jgi:hypothetical protein